MQRHWAWMCSFEQMYLKRIQASSDSKSKSKIYSTLLYVRNLFIKLQWLEIGQVTEIVNLQIWI